MTLRTGFQLVVVCLLGLKTITGISQNDNSNRSFKDYYPISERPYLTGGFGNNDYEKILLEAKPVVYYSIYNNILRNMNVLKYKHLIYISI